ncbi:hypothetical protein C4D60_Mb08t30040 [Musa balbisiana]|uniref:DUF6821 domain-containing protein n=1 Tax=Musa balbisiana TaxID=52838 RepID=A0A4S8K7I5_MUSBA|nr:hypothetical protein C4D60_Mb08t30040 [Musa balbisiana]
MELEEWELLTENGLLNANQEPYFFPPTCSIDADYFAGYPRTTKEWIQHDAEATSREIAPAAAADLEGPEEKESSPPSSFDVSEEDEALVGEYLEQEMPDDCNGFCSMWRLAGVGTLCTVGVAAAAVVIMFMVGRDRNKRNKAKLRRKTR